MAGRDLDRGRFLIPDPITVTLTRPESRQGGAAASVTVGRVQEQAREQRKVDQPDGGSLDGTFTRFHLWLVECLSMPPKKDYRIVHPDGTVWRIQEVEPLAHGRRFRLHCIQHHGTATS